MVRNPNQRRKYRVRTTRQRLRRLRTRILGLRKWGWVVITLNQNEGKPIYQEAYLSIGAGRGGRRRLCRRRRRRRSSSSSCCCCCRCCCGGGGSTSRVVVVVLSVVDAVANYSHSMGSMTSPTLLRLMTYASFSLPPSLPPSFSLHSFLLPRA